ncbi:hypothetical protein VB773_14235 [Haloarculaceae archaeon H-GB2-1]|nr:hypothetical protein [Haloarculaceae archaeon H-GB2-1]
MTLTARLGGRGTLGLGLLAVALLWVVLNTSLASAVAGPVAVLTSNLQLFAGLTVIALVGYWLVDEFEDDDDLDDTVEKAGDRAGEASAGFVNLTTATLGAAAAVLVTIGDQLFATVSEAPMIAGQALLGALGIGAGIGAVPVEVVILGALLVIVVSGILRGDD